MVTASIFLTPHMIVPDRSPIFTIAMILMPLLFLLALLNTNFAIIMLIFSMLLSPEYILGGITGRNIMIRLDDIIILMVFCGWMLKMAIHQDLGLTRISSLNKPIGAYILMCVFSSAWGAVAGTTNFLQSTFYVLKYVEYFMIFFMISNNIEDIPQIKRFIKYILATAVIVNIYALYSHFSLGLRATAPFEGKSGEANTLAGYLLIIMSITLSFMLYTKVKKAYFVYLGIFILSFTVFLYTLSRSGWLGFIPMFAVFLFMAKRNRSTLIIIACIFAMAGPIIIPKIVEKRIKETFIGEKIKIGNRTITIDESTMDRVRAIKRAAKIWKEHPYIGHGVPAGWNIVDVQYARVLHEVGAIGLIIFLWLITTVFRISLTALRNDDIDEFGKSIALAHCAALAGMTMMCWGAEVFIIIRIMEPFWFITAIVAVLPKLYAKTNDIKINQPITHNKEIQLEGT